MGTSRGRVERLISRRELLRDGGFMLGALSLSSGRAVAEEVGGTLSGEDDTGGSWGAVSAFTTRNAIDSEGFDTKAFWFDERNGATLVLGPETSERRDDALRERYVGWRVVEAGVTSAATAANTELTTVFLPADQPVDTAAIYGFEAVTTLVEGRFERRNNNHTREHLYSVSVVPRTA